MKDESKTEAASGEPAGAAPSGSSSILPPSSFHRFRLSPPWQITPTGDGGARHARKFGRPRTLDASERLWLVCEHVPGAATVSVNGEPVAVLDTSGPVAVDVTHLLRPRNEVVIAVASDGPLGAVALEVRPA